MSKYVNVKEKFYQDSKESATYIDSLFSFLKDDVVNDKPTEINLTIHDCEMMTDVPVICLFQEVITNDSIDTMIQNMKTQLSEDKFECANSCCINKEKINLDSTFLKTNKCLVIVFETSYGQVIPMFTTGTSMKLTLKKGEIVFNTTDYENSD